MNKFQLFRIKICIDWMHVWNKLQWITPSYTHYFGAEPIFLTVTLADWQVPSHCFEASGWSWAIFQRGLLSRDGISLWFLKRRIRWDPLSQLQSFRNFFHARNVSRIETDGNLKVQYQGCMLGVIAVRFIQIPEGLENVVWRKWSDERGFAHSPNPPWRRLTNVTSALPTSTG